jgi:hypothetical protein
MNNMGFTPGDFYSEDGKYHFEGGGNGIITLWNKDETKSILRMTVSEARQAASQLLLLVEMAEEDRL